MLQRIRELGVEAGNATVGSSDAGSINTEVTALQSEINRLAGTTTFNGVALLSGGSGSTVGAGGVVVGAALTTSTSVVSAVDVSAAKAGTYTLSSGTNTLTLTNGSVAQTVAVSAMPASGTQTFNFSQLGVSFTVTGPSGVAAAALESDLGGAALVPPVVAIAGSSDTDLVSGDTLTQTDPTPVLVQDVGYYPSGAISAPPPTAVASTGVTPGTITLAVDPAGHVTGSLGGENFTGDLAAFQKGHTDTIVLTGSRGNTIALTYHQSATAGQLADEATDFTGSSMTFVAVPGSATVTGMTVNPLTPAGTYTFSSSGPGSITLSGPAGSASSTVTDLGAFGTETLNFFPGNSVTLRADANGMSAAAIVSSLLQPQNDTVVVASTGGSAGHAGLTIVTAAGAAGQSVFQVGANANETVGVNFASATTTGLGLDAALAAFDTATTGNGGANWAGSQKAAVANLLTATDTAIGILNNTASNLGAVQNRLGHTIAAVGVASENLNSSESRIRDLNVAAEMVNFTKTQILQQAGTAILAQANSAPQSILTLLR
jgi:flagellin